MRRSGAGSGGRNTQRLGDYVLAHGYVREEHVLDQELPAVGADTSASRDARRA
jgi:nucleoside phosphorylase